MSKRETDKIITIGKRKFKVEKFDALTGSYIVFTLMEKLLPMGMEAKAGLENMPQNRQSLSRGEFLQLQRDCLGVVSEILPAGPRPVIAENGQWGIADLERNTQLVILLTIHALAFNVADFFGGEGLQELKASLVSIFPANMPTLTDTPTPQ